MKMRQTCFKCLETKSLEDFYRHPQMSNGRLGKCKECTKKDVSQNYALRRKKYSDYEKARNKLPYRRAKKVEYSANHKKRHPDRHAARKAVATAIKDGLIDRGVCEVCGERVVQAHHDDYSKPLEVRWLCFKHHREHGHNQTVTSKWKSPRRITERPRS